MALSNTGTMPYAFLRGLQTVVLLILLGGMGAVTAGAQDVQVPFDRDSTLYSLDEDLRRQLDLFPDVTGYQGAELYRLDSTAYELVIRYQIDERIRRERRPLSVAEVQALRDRVAQARSRRRDTKAFEDGRYGLIASTTLHGLAEGSLLAGAFGLEDENVLTLPLMGGAIGFFGPLLATRDGTVTAAEADMTFYGGVQGYLHAVQVAGIIGDDQLGGRATAGVAALAGAIEGTVAYRTARTYNWSGGHAEMVSFNGLAGNLVGVGLGAAIVGDDGEDVPRLVAGTSLLGSVGGAYLGHRMGRSDRYTEGDARVYLQSAIQGVNLTGSALTLTDGLGVRPVALLLTGSALGSGVIGRRLVRNRDFTDTQSLLVALGSVTGSLAGLAVTLEVDDGSSRALAQGIGSAAGFGVTYAILEGDARQQASPATSDLDLNVRVSPSLAGGQWPVGRGTDRLAPRVTLLATF